jgi:hypothetical protein
VMNRYCPKIDTEDSGLHTETNNTDGYDTL